jgi:hypothetical protein
MSTSEESVKTNIMQVRLTKWHSIIDLSRKILSEKNSVDEKSEKLSDLVEMEVRHIFNYQKRPTY